jgi:hypothetical protein
MMGIKTEYRFECDETGCEAFYPCEAPLVLALGKVQDAGWRIWQPSKLAVVMHVTCPNHPPPSRA